jgi:nucleotide-binding universal stress UspA family protein
MILICYDGSPDSRAAIEHAGELLDGQPAIILTVWERFVEMLARTSIGLGATLGSVDVDEIDKARQQSAEQLAAEGAELARHAGLNAQPRTRARVTTIAEAVLSEADEAGASAIVMGSRGLGRLGSLLMGSVSHAVVQHAERPVIVVPSPDIALERSVKRHAHHTTA